MTDGRLFATTLPATSATELYKIAPDQKSVFTVRVTNTGSVEATYRLALTDGDAPVAGEYIIYEAVVPPHRMEEHTAIVLQAGHALWARSSSTDLNFVGYGIEERA